MEHYDALQGLPLAMAYVPWQLWQNVSDGARGLEQGSIFEELVFPFEYAGPGCRNTRCCRQNMRQMTRPVRNTGSVPCQRRGDLSCQELTAKN